MKNSKKLLTLLPGYTIIYLASRMRHKQHGRNNIAFGVWLSLARAPGLGPGGRRFESCHPDSYKYARVAQLVERDLAKVEAAGSSPVSRLILWGGSIGYIVYSIDLFCLETEIAVWGRQKCFTGEIKKVCQMAQEVIKVKLLYQFGIIMFVTFLGEFLHCLIPLPIPASIYGLLLMLAGLMTKVIKLEQVKIAADFLIEIMPPMFIPAAVGLIVTWSDLKAILVPVLVITCITTVFVMVVTGRTAQAVMHLKENMAAQKMEKQD